MRRYIIQKGHHGVIVTCLVAYVLAIAVAGVLVAALENQMPALWLTLSADVGATLVIFLIGLALRNSSLYDPYWSVAPMVIAGYWLFGLSLSEANGLRGMLVFGLVCLWGMRLTFNCLRRWPSLTHEDFRYQDLRLKTGAAYWLVDLFGIQMMPTLLVFLGCLPLYPALVLSSAPLNGLDGVAALVTGFGIFYEALADRQLAAFLKQRSNPSRVCTRGVWGRSRHPNYLGEMSFWWGLWLFALAAAPNWWWTGIGALAITLLFVFISIPMMQERHKSRRKDYETQVASIPLILPRLS